MGQSTTLAAGESRAENRDHITTWEETVAFLRGEKKDAIIFGGTSYEMNYEQFVGYAQRLSGIENITTQETAQLLDNFAFMIDVEQTFDKSINTFVDRHAPRFSRTVGFGQVYPPTAKEMALEH